MIDKRDAGTPNNFNLSSLVTLSFCLVTLSFCLSRLLHFSNPSLVVEGQDARQGMSRFKLVSK